MLDLVFDNFIGALTVTDVESVWWSSSCCTITSCRCRSSWPCWHQSDDRCLSSDFSVSDTTALALLASAVSNLLRCLHESIGLTTSGAVKAAPIEFVFSTFLEFLWTRVGVDATLWFLPVVAPLFLALSVSR